MVGVCLGQSMHAYDWRFIRTKASMLDKTLMLVFKSLQEYCCLILLQAMQTAPELYAYYPSYIYGQLYNNYLNPHITGQYVGVRGPMSQFLSNPQHQPQLHHARIMTEIRRKDR